MKVMLTYSPPGRWYREGACLGVDPEVFHPGRGQSTDEAKQVCQTCPVAQECLIDALCQPQTHGVRGGLSEKERSAVVKFLGRMRRCAGCRAPFHTYSPQERMCGDGCRRSTRLATLRESHARAEVK